MALFKIFEGTLAELNQVPEKEGYAYFLTDEQLFVIDTSDGRKYVNAISADSAEYAQYLTDKDNKHYTVDEILELAGKVKSINGQTGEVVLQASDVGAATSKDIDSAINSLNSSVEATAGKYISSITQSNGKITATKADFPTIDASSTTGTGDIKPGTNKKASFSAVNDVTASGHTVKPNKVTYTIDLSDFAKTSELPTIPSGTGGTTAANDAKVIGGVVLNGHTLSAAQKTISAGNGVSVVGGTGSITIAHADTSSQASVNNSGRTYIQDITLDEHGHVTGLASATETVIDTNTTYDLAASKSSTNGNVKLNLTAGGSGSGTDEITIKGSGATTVTTDVNGVITISSTDNDTKSFSISADATDDDVVILTGTAGTNGVSYNAKHATKGPSTTANTSKGPSANVSVSGYGSSGSIVVPKLTVDKYGHTTVLGEQTLSITMPAEQALPTIPPAIKNPYALTFTGSVTGSYDGSAAMTANIPTALKNPNALTVGNKTYDGSSAINITAEDLGLSAAMKFLGTTTTVLVDGVTTNPIVINGGNVAAAAGNVVLYDNKEFVWDGTQWEILGDEGSHALKTIKIAAGNGLTGGGTLAADMTISHADTSSATSISATSRKYINSITVDGFGHVTAMTTGTESDQDLSNYKTKQTAVSSPVASGNATAFIDTISQDANGNIAVTKKNVTFPTLSGGTAAAADAKVIGGVTVNGYAITATQKTLTAGNGISITGAADKITIANTYSYTLPVATSSALGGVKSGTDITVDSDGNVSVNDNSHAHTIANITNLQAILDAKAPLASPTFTGTPKAPTAAAGTNTTQIATTAFVSNALSSFSTKPWSAGTTAPTNTNLFWIDTKDSNNPILKYYNGSAWVALSAVWGG